MGVVIPMFSLGLGCVVIGAVSGRRHLRCLVVWGDLCHPVTVDEAIHDPRISLWPTAHYGFSPENTGFVKTSSNTYQGRQNVNWTPPNVVHPYPKTSRALYITLVARQWHSPGLNASASMLRFLLCHFRSLTFDVNAVPFNVVLVSWIFLLVH